MTIDQIMAWLKAQVPNKELRRLLVAYALQLGAAEELRQQAKKGGIPDATLKMVEAGGPALYQHLAGLADR